MLLVRRDVEGGRQLGHTQQVLGQGAGQRQNPGVETCLSWRKERGTGVEREIGRKMEKQREGERKRRLNNEMILKRSIRGVGE